MPKWLARNTLVIPGDSNFPSDKSSGKKCPNCGAKILILIPKKDPKTGKTKKLCPNCGKEINPES
jgi:predicted RNA-binding Zn-ribbon protein involved in translation (DUF1610 family)